LLRNLRKGLSRACAATELFGFKQRKQHIVICGFPRAGSSLLQLMIENCLPNCQAFGREVSALDAASAPFSSHSIMLSKRPNDIFQIADIKKYYEKLDTNVQFLVTIRDARDVLVSKHQGVDGYYVDCQRWKKIANQIDSMRDDEAALVIKFEDLVRSTGDVQKRIVQFTRIEFKGEFERFFEEEQRQCDVMRAINGLRPPDPAAIGKWRSDDHLNRMKLITDEIRNLGQWLVKWEYESDDKWQSAYRSK